METSIESLKQKSPQDVVKYGGRDVRVPDGKDVTIDGNDNDVFLVTVRNFADLQTLNLVPPQLNEGVARAAIAADDAGALTLAESFVSQRGENCGCNRRPSQCPSTAIRNNGGLDLNLDDVLVRAQPIPRTLIDRMPAEIPFKNAFAQDLAVTFNGIRKTLNPQLSAALTPILREPIRFDSRLSSIVRGWINRVDVSVIPILVWRPQNIEIGRNATLRLAPDVRSLRANNILIHVGGRLIAQGGYLKIVSASIRGNVS